MKPFLISILGLGCLLGHAATAQLLLQPSPVQLSAILELEGSLGAVRDEGLIEFTPAVLPAIPVATEDAYVFIGEFPPVFEVAATAVPPAPVNGWEFYSTSGIFFFEDGEFPEIAFGTALSFPEATLDFSLNSNWVSFGVFDALKVASGFFFSEPIIFLGRNAGTVYGFSILYFGDDLGEEEEVNPFPPESDFSLFGDGDFFTPFEGQRGQALFVIDDIFVVAAVPEPSTVAWLALGGLAAAVWFRRRRARS